MWSVHGALAKHGRAELIDPKVGDVVFHDQLGRGKVIVTNGCQVYCRFNLQYTWLWPNSLQVVKDESRAGGGSRGDPVRVDRRVVTHGNGRKAKPNRGKKAAK